jgi:predicted transglutaminase-like cysteine proteinase
MRGLIRGLTALSLIATANFAAARDRVAPIEPMPKPATVSLPTGLATAPIGWTQFCGSNPSECAVEALVPERIALSRANWALISRINKDVNAAIEQVEDQDHFGVVELWTYPVDGKGDCEDLVLLKRRRLIEAGMPRQALMITVVRDEIGAGHAVLTVRTDRGDYVLDNKTDRILDWRATGYAFVKRQSQESPNIWVAIGEHVSGVTITAGNLPH